MLTTFDADAYVLEALRAGASGFVLKDVTRDELAPSVTRRMIARFVALPDDDDARPGDRLVVLTAREREVLGQIAVGRSNAEIAREFVVSENTVKTHVGNVLMKLQLRDRVHAVILAPKSPNLVRPR